MAAELWATRKQNMELRKVLGDIAHLKEQDKGALAQAKERITKIKSLALDQMTLLGQVDVGIWGAREVSLERFLNPDFKKVLQNQNKYRGGDRETRHESNSLLHKDLDSMVARRSKESKVDSF